MRYRHLLGIVQKKDRTLDRIVQKLLPSLSLAHHVGIEMPDDYQQRTGDFLSLFGRYLENHGQHVVPLETVKGHDERAVLRLVRKVVEGTYPYKKFIDDLRDYRHRKKEDFPYMAPEKENWFLGEAVVYECTWELLRVHPAINTVLSSWEKAERNFEHTAIGRIRKHNVDFVVVGYDHAVRMHPQLPGYKFERM